MPRRRAPARSRPPRRPPWASGGRNWWRGSAMLGRRRSRAWWTARRRLVWGVLHRMGMTHGSLSQSPSLVHAHTRTETRTRTRMRTSTYARAPTHPQWFSDAWAFLSASGAATAAAAVRPHWWCEHTGVAEGIAELLAYHAPGNATVAQVCTEPAGHDRASPLCYQTLGRVCQPAVPLTPPTGIIQGLAHLDIMSPY
jgi:hypothetical protein